ncbi:MAG: trehalose-phosphatase [Pseudomonadota bacterium]
MDLVDLNTPSLPLPPALPSWAGAGRPSLFVDFDGTLVDIASGPDAISPLDGLAQMLGNLSDQLGGAFAMVSGRSIADIEKHTGPLSVAVAGSHGADVRLADGSTVGEPPQSMPDTMEAALRGFAAETELNFERKPHGGALHYRSAPDQEDAAKGFAAQVARDHGWTLQHGKCVVEVVAGRSDKGTAVEAFMGVAPFAGTKPLFIGDDLTDEKGFAACETFGGGGILVGDRASTAAHYRLPDVGSVHRWLGL